MAKMCKNCGAVMDDSFNNCTNCGAILESAPAQPTVQPAAGQVPPQQPQQPMYNQQPMYGQPYPVDPNTKSKLAAGLLGIFLGSLGVHNFYLGYTGKAVAQLLITLLTCGIGAIVTSIWGLIEGIFILTGKINVDAQGRPLGD